jgi:peptidoglycan/LPS O-acetylase OafA/YrhL
MKLDQLTFTRFVAAMAVVILHTGSTVFPFNHPYIYPLVLKFNYAVSYFFILSGFIMIVAYNRYEKINTLEFLKNRIARIYPLLIFSVILLILHGYFFNYEYINYYLIDGLWNISSLQTWVPGKALCHNYPVWSLTVEMFFYLVFPFFFNYIYKKNSFNKLTNWIMFFWIFCQFFYYYLLHYGYYQPAPSISHDLIYYFPPSHLNEFLIGNLAGIFYVNYLKGKENNYDVFVILFFMLTCVFFRFPMGVEYHNGFLALAFVPLILFSSVNNGWITKISQTKPLIFLGEISFGVYLLHIPVHRFVTSLLPEYGITEKTATFYIFVAILLLVSALSHLFIEKPCRDLIRSVKLRKQHK